MSCNINKCIGTEADVKLSTLEQRPPSATAKKESKGVPAKGHNLFNMILQEIASKEVLDCKTGIFGIKRSNDYDFENGNLCGGEISKSLEISKFD